ncbi:MAG: YhbY family RNA-binding protein [Candidatus Heimdallarchaeota archaeon]|nr:YhbY family RNA-binding protein [Candidatus Heimdallarchaeota archaeon]MCK4876158.1 YhbY family RNA-binding protein [Candidatus Heimdallarchaeota archaeon]
MKTNTDRIRHDPAKIRIGKRGITEGIISEVKAVLKKDQVVKIKCLKIVPTEGIKAIADNIANLTHCNVVEIRGKTFILASKTLSYK